MRTASNRTRLNLTVLEDRTTPAVTVLATMNAAEPNMTGLFEFARDGSTSESLTVNITVSGTATTGTDYRSFGTTVTFSASSAYAYVNVTPIDDTIYDPNETIIVTVGGNSATMTITDNETSNTAPQILDFTAVDLGNGVFQFTGRVIDESPGGLTITFSGGGTMSGKTTTTNSDGTFSYTVQLLMDGSDDGTVGVSTVDSLNQASNVPQVYVRPSI